MAEKTTTAKKIVPIYGGAIKEARNEPKGPMKADAALLFDIVNTEEGHGRISSWREFSVDSDKAVIYAMKTGGASGAYVVVAGYKRAVIDNGYVVETIPKGKRSTIESELSKKRHSEVMFWD